MNFEIGGETGIRTPEPVAQLLPFQGSAIDHSAISPNQCRSILHELNLRISQSNHGRSIDTFSYRNNTCKKYKTNSK